MLEVTITEGRKRQVRRMFQAIGHRVLRLRRTEIGPIELGDLPEGDTRFLTSREVADLKHAVRLD
jgi:pseudouridine synthase